MVDYNKIDVNLTLAFQNSDGPFNVLVLVDGLTKKIISLNKADILELSDDPHVYKIELDCRLINYSGIRQDRRWRKR